MALSTSRDDDATPKNRIICLQTTDDEWKFRVTPPNTGAPEAFGSAGTRSVATPFGETPKYKMELKLKRKIRCKCIGALEGFEDAYDSEDYEIDPSDVSKDCDADGFRTMLDQRVEMVGLCLDPLNPIDITQEFEDNLYTIPCKCAVDIECEWVTEDLYDTFIQNNDGRLTGNSQSENRDDSTVDALANKCACMHIRRSPSMDINTQSVIFLSKSGGCFDCVMNSLSCEQGIRGTSAIAFIMTELLKDGFDETASLEGICGFNNCEDAKAYAEAAGCFEIKGFTKVE